MNTNGEMDPELMKKLALLQATRARDPQKEKAGRTVFLQEAREFAKAVTPAEKGRHNGWMHALQSILLTHRKEQSPMFSTLATIILIASIVFGGSGITVAAAQNSQPDQPLYGLKVLSEELRLGLSADPQSEYQLSLEFANRRAIEMQVMLQSGNLPSEEVQARYQNQVAQAIQLAANFPDDQALQALDQMRTRLQTQQQAFLQVQAVGTPQAEAVLLRTRQMLQEHLQWVEAGLTDPVKLRDQLRLHDQLRQQDPLGSATPMGQSTQAPGTGDGNPWTTGTPTPGSGYGPGNGTGTCENCTPAANGQGANPWTTGTPTPGSGYGPGPQPTQAQYGQPTQAGPHPTQKQYNQPTQAVPQPTQKQYNQPTQAGPQPTQNQPTQAGPQPTEQQKNQPTQAGPQPTSAGPGPQPTSLPGGPGGKP